ncbi:hypothetical protein [Kitasatospora sp. CB01950]|uniref:hypothetical protein n=1 Tax=Kitasatospora sp. CB01950 TaxID=1703930 RepID=UPI00093F880B|nr:hypothetical protein [Kitasatospora sp. CB01950]OKJ05252.1 hypothetical protein AMK19_26040 [Kitasatospora sp. CB01950]
MNLRKPAAAALLACSVLALTACDPDTAANPAPATSSAAGGSAAAPSAGASAGGTGATGGKSSAPAKPAGDVKACGGSEKESDVKAELTLDRSADPRITGVIKLTNTTSTDCVVYGKADLRTDHTAQFEKLVSGVLGSGTFATDKANGTVLHPNVPVYQAVTWLASPPVAPNSSCTTGSLLVMVRNEGVLTLPMPVKDARYCPVKEEGSDQVQIGVPQASEAEAKAQLRALGK